MNNVMAYAAFDPKKPLGPFTISRREPGINDVQIDIKYCGVCHSDVHQARDEWGGSIFPMVPGHEIVGVVSKTGHAVKKYKVGDKVGVGCLVDSCRTCSSCKEGLEQYCENGSVPTYNGLEKDGKTPTFGGYSTHIIVHEDFVLKIPENLPLDAAAPLLCAGITTYSPLKHWKAGPGKKIGVIGLGGLGHMAVKIGHALGAEITVFSHSERKREDAKRFGARNFVVTKNQNEMEALTNTLDLIINTVSVELDWNLYLRLLKRDSSMVILGVPSKAPEVSAFGLIAGRKSLAGSLIGGIAETQEMLDFCGRNNIVCDIERVAIQDINTAYERMVKGDVRYRFVIDIESLK